MVAGHVSALGRTLLDRVKGSTSMSKRWYVVHAYSGFEAQVKRSLKERIERKGMQDMFGDILVPTEEVVEMRSFKDRLT